jgi:photosystem II stability/assembly factor-like uncharacterized protein
MINQNPPKEDFVYQLAATEKWAESQAVCFSARASGLYRSEDGGDTWRTSLDSLNLREPLSVQALLISPKFGRDRQVFIGIGGGILRSWDGGQKWERAYLPSPPPLISALVISPNYENDGKLFAGTLEDGILCSSDEGRRWHAWNFGLLDLSILCLALSPNFAEDETIYAGTQSGIFRSTNGGRAWREVNLMIGFEPVLSLALSPNFSRDASLFAGTENQGLLCSNDAGQTWRQLGKSILKEPLNTILLAPDFPARPEILVLHGGTLMRSVDCGKTWKAWRAGELSKKDVTAVYAPHGFDQPVLAGCSDGSVLSLR